jgi:hypothetical protein
MQAAAEVFGREFILLRMAHRASSLLCAECGWAVGLSVKASFERRLNVPASSRSVLARTSFFVAVLLRELAAGLEAARPEVCAL